MACRSVLLALPGKPAVRSLVVSTMATMSSMAAVSKHVHADKGDGDQYPDPIRC
jgi:hypothetical protein